MPDTRPTVIVTRKLPEVTETRMKELFDTRLNDDDTPMSEAALVAAMQEADVLVPTVTDQIDAKLIGQAGENLKLIANYGNGVDNIDLPAARERGITVTNTPGVLTEDTADMTMALILAVPRRLNEGQRLVRGGDWPGWISCRSTARARPRPITCCRAGASRCCSPTPISSTPRAAR